MKIFLRVYNHICNQPAARGGGAQVMSVIDSDYDEDDEY